MEILLAILGGTVLVGAGALTGATLWLKRRNQVVAGVKSPAPLGWLTSGRREAKLHRRLRASGRRLELVAPTEDVNDIVGRLRIELVELDDYLVTISRRPSSARRADRKVVVERIEAVEQLTRRVEDRSRDLVSLDELNERLDMLEAADSELDDLIAGAAFDPPRVDRELEQE
ncbi:MAG: hypothetical protein AAF548_13035 [Actinomycetota bacterium]